MSRKVFYKESTVKGWIHEIVRAMARDEWRPDYKASPESNLWMAEDAFGWTEGGYKGLGGDGAFDYTMHAKNILIVDDINDSGATLNWIKQDWQSSCLPDNSRWANVFGHNVRFAVLINNEASEFKDVDYVGMNINKLEEPIWCVFPWEDWWNR